MKLDRERFLAAVMAVGAVGPAACNGGGAHDDRVTAEPELRGKATKAGAFAAPGAGNEGAGRGKLVRPTNERLASPTGEGLPPPSAEGLPPPSADGLPPPHRALPPPASACATPGPAKPGKVPPPPIGRPMPH